MAKKLKAASQATTEKTTAPTPYSQPGRVVDVPPTARAMDTTRFEGVSEDKQRVNFRPEEFARAIKQHGKTVIWRKALQCPCETSETDQASLDCEQCGGNGFIYIQPMQIQAVMMQFDAKINIFEKMGVWQEGACNVTVDSHHRLGFRDSIEMTDAVIPFNEVITKGNRRGLRFCLPENRDSGRFRIRNVAAAAYQGPDGIAFLEEGFHFAITREGWLAWLPGAAGIRDGTRISLHYDFAPIYLAVSHMHVTRTDVTGRKQARGVSKVIDLPAQAMLKLSFLVDANLVPSMSMAIPSPSGLDNPLRKPRDFGGV